MKNSGTIYVAIHTEFGHEKEVIELLKKLGYVKEASFAFGGEFSSLLDEPYPDHVGALVKDKKLKEAVEQIKKMPYVKRCDIIVKDDELEKLLGKIKNIYRVKGCEKGISIVSNY